jgi:hypothetical protein
MLTRVGLAEDLERAAAAASPFAQPGEEVAAVIPTEPRADLRVYLCAFRAGEEPAGWIALDDDARPVEDRILLRDAVSVAALCEIADEVAGGGDLEGLRAQLATLRITEAPEGIEEAEEAALALERMIAPPPRLASPAYLDGVGLATRRLEQALGDTVASPFGEALKRSLSSVDELKLEVETNYRGRLS